ncbi:MAG: metal-dependent hydrolase, partial [Rubrobacteraceae bacterium]
VVVLLALYFALKIGLRDRRSILLWFLLGWFGHTIADFLTHVDDTRPLFWPLSNWEWSSPVSYYNSAYYWTEFQLVNNSLMLFLIVLLLALRIRRRFKAKNGNQ